MRLPSINPLFLLSSLAAVTHHASAEPVLRSSSLAACQENSHFTASLFDVVFTPNNNSVFINMLATSSVEGYVVFDVNILAYGFQVIRTTINPCTSNLPGLCPMVSGKMGGDPFNLPVSADALEQVPGIAYSFPDLDATVKVLINMTSGDQAGETIACVEAEISNGKTVDLIGVKWATAAVAGLAILSSAVVSGLGYSNAASHVASNTLSLFAYFQAQAMLGLCAVPLPPAVKAWTQDFQWSMGIINVRFVQDILTWYQRSTGGTATDILKRLKIVSVQVEKRSLSLIEPAVKLARRSVGGLAKRAYEQTPFGSYIVYGIQRVAFRAGIETTNLFLTGLTFFYVFLVLAALAVVIFKLGCELAVKLKWMKSETFCDFRAGWFTVLKGILYRVLLIGFPQMTILCLWEFTQTDSAGAIVLAVFFFFGMLFALSYAAYRVIRMARRSLVLHRNPAYILFSDIQALNKWGFLYVQFRASAYYFIVPVLIYTLVKGMFIALAQRAGTVQAVALIIIEAAALIAASVLRPWMDKSTNSFNIAICAMNFINAIFLFIFTDVFGLPRLVIGVVGVVLWIANAAFSLILLLMLIVTTGLVLFRNNPDTRYQFMNDDRTSFMKSQTHIATTNELDALAMTARGSGGLKRSTDLDDGDSTSGMAAVPPRPSTANSRPYSMRESGRDSVQNSIRNSARSSLRAPIDAATGMYSSEANLRGKPSGSLRESSPLGASGSSSNLSGRYSGTAHKPTGGGGGGGGASTWQRGAGYD
ncbi:hypothetical protein VTK26DRAFT_122 [Humicola hyalothermophila]